MSAKNRTPTVYFSDLLQHQFPRFAKDLFALLAKHRVPTAYLQNTKDIWCQDYMPVRVNENKWVQFHYDPDYLIGHERLKTVPVDVTGIPELRIARSNLKIDGGNVVKCDKKVILTDKVFIENHTRSRTEIISELENLFETDKIYFIPRLPYDHLGHSDGMVRFINDDILLVSCFKNQSRSFASKFKRAVSKINVEAITVPYLELGAKRRSGIHSARGCYINFLRVNDILIVPAFNLREDEMMVKLLEDYYQTIESSSCNEIANLGGVLNCISWVYG